MRMMPVLRAALKGERPLSVVSHSAWTLPAKALGIDLIPVHVGPDKLKTGSKVKNLILRVLAGATDRLVDAPTLNSGQEITAKMREKLTGGGNVLTLHPAPLSKMLTGSPV